MSEERAQPKHKRLKTIKKFAQANSIANIIAVGALVIASLSVWTAIQANRNASQADKNATAARRAADLTQYATGVSYWDSGSGNNTQVVVQNRGGQPISDVMVTIVPAQREPYVSDGIQIVIGLGDIPSCSIMTYDIANIARLSLVGYGPNFQGFPGSVYIPGDNPAPWLALAKQKVQSLEGKIKSLEKLNGFGIRTYSLNFTDVDGHAWFRMNGLGFAQDEANYYVGTAPVHREFTHVGCS